jgi:hypothetical protein
MCRNDSAAKRKIITVHQKRRGKITGDKNPGDKKRSREVGLPSPE